MMEHELGRQHATLSRRDLMRGAGLAGLAMGISGLGGCSLFAGADRSGGGGGVMKGSSVSNSMTKITDVVIPAALVRRVRDDIQVDFDKQIKSLQQGGRVSPEGVLSSGMLLKRVHEILPYRERLIEELQDKQDPETGMMKNVPQYNCWAKGIADVTSYLRLLGGTLRKLPDRLVELSKPGALVQWARERDWNRPWGGETGAGHMIVGVMFSMSDLGLLNVRDAEAVFDFLDTMRDERHGVWAKGHFDPENPGSQQLGGAFYFGMLYDRFRRPLPGGEGACRMLMAMQQKTGTGTYCMDPNFPWPHASTDHDALYVLLRYARLNGELWQEVLPSVAWYAQYFVKQMTEGGGYTTRYPIDKVVSLLRPVFPDPEDDLPYWDYMMYAWVL